MKRETARSLRVLALVTEQPKLPTLWLLVELASQPDIELLCLAPQHEDELQGNRWTRLAVRFLTARYRGKQQHNLDELFDGPSLRRWWREEARVITGIPNLEHSHAIPGIAAFGADVIVSFRRVGLAAALADPTRRVLIPRVGGGSVEDAMDVVMRAIAHGRTELLEAAIYGVDREALQACFWSGTPQVAPGDTGEELLLRTTVELGAALTRHVCDGASPVNPLREAIATPAPMNAHVNVPETIDLRTWLAYMRLDAGRHSRHIDKRAVRC